jgi:hypothetical protein
MANKAGTYKKTDELEKCDEVEALICRGGAGPTLRL